MSNNYLSRSTEFDRPEYYRFSRNTGLPYGTFDKPMSAIREYAVIGLALVAFLATVAAIALRVWA